MRTTGPLHGDTSGPRVVAALLMLSLLLVAVLAAQAQYAARSHRAMAEKVLRDYAALAADEFARRAAAEVGYYGYYPVIVALGEAVRAEGGRTLPAPADLGARAGEGSRRAFLLARTSFLADVATGRLETAGPPIEPEVAAWIGRTIRERGAAPLPAGRRYEAWYARLGGTLRGCVAAPLEGAEGSPQRLVGFAVDPEALVAALRRALDRAPLLPPSVGAGAVTNAAIDLSVVDPFGGEVLRQGGAFPELLGAEKRLGPEFSGLLEGFVVRATLDPDAAPRLVIGGLPRSRLPILLGLLALTSGLVGAALFLLRRERALNRLRSDFVSGVSHELRTPLTQIRMFAETLVLDRVRSEEERRRSLAIIDREARRLSHLVENILRFSRAERGAVRLEPRPRDLAPLLRDLLDEFRPVAEGCGARIAARLEEGVVAAVDDDALRQILLNLLDNAVKYGPAGQEVRVGLAREPAGARVWVDDEGPGVPPPERERIWKRFHRLEVHKRSPVAGTGIGLAVVRDLVSRQGGRSWVEAGERRGARFVVEFPARAAAAGGAA